MDVFNNLWKCNCIYFKIKGFKGFNYEMCQSDLTLNPGGEGDLDSVPAEALRHSIFPKYNVTISIMKCPQYNI